MSESAILESTLESAYRMLWEDGWADHYRCGWTDGPDGERTVPDDDPMGMCGKEYAERESLRIILGTVAAAAFDEGAVAGMAREDGALPDNPYRAHAQG